MTTSTSKEDHVIANRPGSVRERFYASTTDTFDGDIDFIAIERALNGDAVRLTTEEKLLAARLLDARGLAPSAIGKLIRTDPYTVGSWKANNWQPGKPAPRAALEPAKCGEPRMYRQHLKRGEKCDKCRAANAAADRRYRLTGSRNPA